MTNTAAILHHLQASSLLEVREWAKVFWVKAVVAGRVICRFVSKKVGATEMNFFQEMQQEAKSAAELLKPAGDFIDGVIRKYGRDFYQNLKIVDKGNGVAVLHHAATNWDVLILHTAFATPEGMMAKGYKPFSIGALRGEEGTYWMR